MLLNTIALKNQKSGLKFISIRNVLVLLFSAFFVLVVYRAINLSFTHDEAISYKIILGQEIFSQTANHHYFNTFLMQKCFYLFGDSPISLRLPNVLAFAIYLVVWFKLISRTNNWFVALFASSIVLLNPIVTDYFSLARGYGLSMGLIMASIYFLIKKTETIFDFQKAAFWSICIAALAMYASFATTNFFIATVGLITIKFILSVKKIKPSLTQWLLFAFLLCGAFTAFWFAYQRLIFLEEKNELYFGIGRIGASINSFFLSTTYIKKELDDSLLYVSYFFLAFLIVVVAVGKLKNAISIVSLLFLFIVLGYIIEFKFLGALLPVERALIFMYPLMNLIVILGLMSIVEKPRSVILRTLLPIALGTLILLISYNFGKSFRLNATRTWDFDQHTQYVVEYLQSKATVNERITVSNHWLFEPSLNYYFASRELNISPATMEVNDSSDYVYTYSNDIDMRKYKSIMEFKELKLGLYQRIKS